MAMGQRPALPSARSGARIGKSNSTPDAIDTGSRMYIDPGVGELLDVVVAETRRERRRGSAEHPVGVVAKLDHERVDDVDVLRLVMTYVTGDRVPDAPSGSLRTERGLALKAPPPLRHVRFAPPGATKTAARDRPGAPIYYFGNSHVGDAHGLDANSRGKAQERLQLLLTLGESKITLRPLDKLFSQTVHRDSSGSSNNIGIVSFGLPKNTVHTL